MLYPVLQSRIMFTAILNGVKLVRVKRKLSAEALAFFKKEGAKGGKIGGKKRLTTITPERRSEIARDAATARWKRKPKSEK